MARRAISEEQKQARQQALLATAWSMFQEQAYEAITVNAIAEQAGVAKGTVYLYFNSKEELFLMIQEQQLSRWFNELDTRLAALASPASIKQVADILCNSLEERTGMTRLLTILHLVLEQNIGLEQARAFKHFLRTHLLRTGALLERVLPFLAAGDGAKVMLQAHVLVIGFRQMAEPVPTLAQLLDDPELALFKIDFTDHFTDSFETLLYGWHHQAQTRQ